MERTHAMEFNLPDIAAAVMSFVTAMILLLKFPTEKRKATLGAAEDELSIMQNLQTEMRLDLERAKRTLSDQLADVQTLRADNLELRISLDEARKDIAALGESLAREKTRTSKLLSRIRQLEQYLKERGLEAPPES